jgi:predicted dehydrogenase
MRLRHSSQPLIVRQATFEVFSERALPPALRRPSLADVTALGTRPFDGLRAGILGVGMVAAVHVDALRRLGVEVVGVVGSTPARAAAKDLAPVYTSARSLLADGKVDVIHVATPNHLHLTQVEEAIAAGVHVICEKPLAISAAEARRLSELAAASGRVHCTNFNIRYYPLVREAFHRIRGGELGRVWNVHGRYIQDWLATPTDWNWRLDSAQAGELRAAGDIGSHWLDLAEFLTGQRIEAVFADLATVIPVRQKPQGPVETYAVAGPSQTTPVRVETEDICHILLRFDGGARGACVLSQVSFGRKNDLRIEIDGEHGSLAWDAENNEELWIGRRDGPNQVLRRQPSLMHPAASPFTALPPGAGEGFADTFRELYRHVYDDIQRGAPSDKPGYPTFADGYRSVLICEAIAQSAREERWIEVA